MTAANAIKSYETNHRDCSVCALVAAAAIALLALTLAPTAAADESVTSCDGYPNVVFGLTPLTASARHCSVALAAMFAPLTPPRSIHAARAPSGRPMLRLASRSLALRFHPRRSCSRGKRRKYRPVRRRLLLGYRELKHRIRWKPACRSARSHLTTSVSCSCAANLPVRASPDRARSRSARSYSECTRRSARRCLRPGSGRPAAGSAAPGRLVSRVIRRRGCARCTRRSVASRCQAAARRRARGCGISATPRRPAIRS